MGEHTQRGVTKLDERVPTREHEAVEAVARGDGRAQLVPDERQQLGEAQLVGRHEQRLEYRDRHRDRLSAVGVVKERLYARRVEIVVEGDFAGGALAHRPEEGRTEKIGRRGEHEARDGEALVTADDFAIAEVARVNE